MEMENEQLRQQLAAEQAKSAELNDFAREHFAAAVEQQERAEAEATIAAMRLSLKEVKEDWIIYDHVKFGNGEEFGLIRPKTADLVFKALSDTVGEVHVDNVKRLKKAASDVLLQHERYRPGHYHATCDCGLCKAMKALYDALGEVRG